jgi:hypothetical protein
MSLFLYSICNQLQIKHSHFYVDVLLSRESIDEEKGDVIQY